MSRFVRGKRWYSRLVHNEERRALLDDHPLGTLDRALVVCLYHSKFSSWKGDAYRLFTRFSSYLDFFPYFNDFNVEERSFYEIVFGQFAQKPHFDIDIQDIGAYSEDLSVIGDKIIEALITGCCQVLAERDIVLNIARDVCIYDSHGPRKRSFHLVLGTMCHSDHQEARAFYQEVIARVHTITGGKYIEFVDMGVYSKLQQFRIVGCQKEGTGRIKRFHEVFQYQGQQYEHIYPEPILSSEHKMLVVLHQSLLSFTSGCRMLPSFAPPPAPYVYPTQIINDVQVEEVIALFQSRMDTSPFSIRGVKDNFIILKRERPSRCPICDITHEHENPMLVVTANRVYWRCRRAMGSYLLGEITTSAQIITDEESEVPISKEPTDEDLMLGDVDYSSLVDQGAEKVRNESTTSPVTAPSTPHSPVAIPPTSTLTSHIEDTTPFKPQLPPMVKRNKAAASVSNQATTLSPTTPRNNINRMIDVMHSKSKYTTAWTPGK